MEEKGTKLTVEASDGATGEYVAYKGLVMPKAFIELVVEGDLADHLRDVMDFELDDGDVFLAAFPKSGTHWAWEIINMLKQGSADYLKVDKETTFLDLVNPAKIAQIPSPRVINSHYTPRCIPRSVLRKGIKIIHVQRNAKDVLVSMYNHFKQEDVPFNDTFDHFLKLFTGQFGLYLFSSWARYVKDWELFSKQHPDQILSLYFEDMKENPVRETRKINEFLQCNRSENLIKDIADACSFAKLKRADRDKAHEYNPPEGFIYRKGDVGDWKNWFTVKQNEQMDQWLEENLTNTSLAFRYTI